MTNEVKNINRKALERIVGYSGRAVREDTKVDRATPGTKTTASIKRGEVTGATTVRAEDLTCDVASLYWAYWPELCISSDPGSTGVLAYDVSAKKRRVCNAKTDCIAFITNAPCLLLYASDATKQRGRLPDDRAL